jgi:Ca2+-binding EF-hand superfamily protein/6,7-dimethyl-8-ribityllumazine synthase
MSTKMSTDLNITRPTSRVIRAPGGGSSIGASIFGDRGASEDTAKASPSPAVASSPARPGSSSNVLAPISESVADSSSNSQSAIQGKVGVVVAGNLESEFLTEGILKALHLAGITGTLLTKVNDIAALPYAAQNLSKSVDVVIAAAFIANDPTKALSSSLSTSLLQLGLSGRTPIIPALPAHDTMLEAKALLPVAAEGWAKAAVTVLDLQFGGSLDISAAPEVVIPPKPVFSTEIKDTDTLLDCLRETLKEHGARGIIGIARKFKIADDNNNGQIDLSEFTKVINEHKLGWTKEQIKMVFDSFDNDKSGGISYDEFLYKLRGNLNERRKNLVLMAFDILDTDKSGVIELDDIRAKYDASKHPDVIAGKRSTDEILSEFLDTFDTEDKDGKVTTSEFCRYYGNISASIDEDDYFELMIRNAWKISGGEGWCANSSCRRVLVTHRAGHQTVEEIKNDIGMKNDDFDGMLANLKKQKINDVTVIELSSGVKYDVKEGKSSNPTATKTTDSSASSSAASDVRPATAPAAPMSATQQAKSFNPRRQPGGASSLVLG